MSKIRIPQEIRHDKPEDERKYSVDGVTWNRRVARLNEIFNFVMRDNRHFVTLDKKLHTAAFHPKLAQLSKAPVEIKHLRIRDYWGNEDLDGYKPGDKGRAELRTEHKIGKGYWEQVLKLGGDGSHTLHRGESKRDLDGYGVNLDVFSKTDREAACDILGDKALAPLIRLEGQSIALLYHPGGLRDVLFEIKFDKAIGRTFDKRFSHELVEVEIEVKDNGSLPERDIEALFDKSERVLLARFSDHLDAVYESKVSKLFRHLVGWRANDKKGFKRAFDQLPRDRWHEFRPS